MSSHSPSCRKSSSRGRNKDGRLPSGRRRRPHTEPPTAKPTTDLQVACFSQAAPRLSGYTRPPGRSRCSFFLFSPRVLRRPAACDGRNSRRCLGVHGALLPFPQSVPLANFGSPPYLPKERLQPPSRRGRPPVPPSLDVRPAALVTGTAMFPALRAAAALSLLALARPCPLLEQNASFSDRFEAEPTRAPRAPRRRRQSSSSFRPLQNRAHPPATPCKLLHAEPSLPQRSHGPCPPARGYRSRLSCRYEIPVIYPPWSRVSQVKGTVCAPAGVTRSAADDRLGPVPSPDNLPCATRWKRPRHPGPPPISPNEWQLAVLPVITNPPLPPRGADGSPARPGMRGKNLHLRLRGGIPPTHHPTTPFPVQEPRLEPRCATQTIRSAIHWLLPARVPCAAGCPTSATAGRISLWRRAR